MRDAVEVGDVMALTMIAAQLTAHSDASAQFSEELHRLVKAFDFDGLLQLAHALDGAATKGPDN